MKILNLSPSLSLGGSERAAVNYAIGYKKLGHDSRFLVVYGTNERSSDLTEQDIQCYVYHGNPSVLAEISKWKPDVIHFHRAVNTDPNIVQIISDIKLVLNPLIVETNIFSRFEYSDWYKNNVDISLQLSTWCLWKYRNWQGKSEKPASCILPYTVNHEKIHRASREECNAFLRNLDIPDNAKVLGRLGQNINAKWSPKLIDIFIKLSETEDNLYLILVRPSPSVIAKVDIQAEKVKQKIRIIDKISGDENLSLFYSSLDIFVHIADIGESFGFVLTEAMLCGCPVVSMTTPYKDNSQIEVVGHTIGGLIAHNEISFVSAVKELLHNADMYNKISSGGRAWVISRYTLEVVCMQAIQLFEEAIRLKQNNRLETLNNQNSRKELDNTIYGILKSADVHLSIFQKIKMKLVHNRIVYKTYQNIKSMRYIFNK